MDKDIQKLEALDLCVQTRHLCIAADWFRAIRHTDVPNHSWHKHTRPEMHFMQQGRNTFVFPDRAIVLKAGDGLIIPADVPHRLENQLGEPYFRYVIKADIQPLTDDPEANFLARTLAVSQLAQFPIGGVISRGLQSSLYEAINRVMGFACLIEMNLLTILMAVARELNNAPQSHYDVREKYSRDELRFQQIGLLIDKHLSDGLTVDFIAERMFLSTRQLQRIAMEQCGQSIRRMIMEARFRRAKALLKDTRMKVMDVSASVGFSNEQNFCRFFTRMEGQPPSQYRLYALSGSMQNLPQEALAANERTGEME